MYAEWMLHIMEVLLQQNEMHSSTPYLLFSTWSTVCRMNLDGSGYTVLVDSASNVGTHAIALQKLKVTLTSKCSYLSCIHLLSYTV